MDRWRKAYQALQFRNLDQIPLRFLLYGVTAAFWAQVAVWLLLRKELIPGVDDIPGWLTLSLVALPGNIRAVFLIALGPNPAGERQAIQAKAPRPRRGIRVRLLKEWERGEQSGREEAPPNVPTNLDIRGGQNPHPQGAPPVPSAPVHYRNPARTAPKRSTRGTLVKVIVGLLIFATCGGYWLTGGTIVSPSDKTTEPPRLRNQAEKRHMLELVNQARAKNGVPPVVMGNNNAAQIHAENLLRDCVLSHWGTDGLKPYMRYTLAGGYQTNAENALTHNECGLADTLLQWNYEPMEMMRDAVDGWMESPGHRETMLDPSYSRVNIGLAWDRNTFKAVQHFEGNYVNLTLLPTIQDGELILEGRLEEEYEFDGISPLKAFIVYDPQPRRLTRGQLAQTSCYSHGEVVATVIPESTFLRAQYEYTETMEGPQCTDPYRMDSGTERPGTRVEMERTWTENKERAEKISEREFSIQVMKARELRVEDREFNIQADVEGLLDEHGPGVYTVALLADLEGKAGLEVISEYSIFHEVAPPGTYSGR